MRCDRRGISRNGVTLSGCYVATCKVHRENRNHIHCSVERNGILAMVGNALIAKYTQIWLVDQGRRGLRQASILEMRAHGRH
jgi:hypothetical protein